MARKASIKKTKTVSRPVNTYLENLENKIQSNQSRLSMVLGGLIILVVVILIFNYFHKSNSEIGPAQNTTSEQQNVSPDKLPGKYTVKDGDTLFNIANTYYQDGYQYPEIAKANNLTNPDAISAGQVLEIPKLDITPTPSPSESPTASLAPQDNTQSTTSSSTDIWGPKITDNTYTVVAGDWLSTIAGRAYGDVYAYDRIAKANNLSDPNQIEVGMTLTIPR